MHTLGRRKLTVLTVTVLCTFAGVAISFLQSPSYAATAQVLLPAQSATSALQPTNLQLEPTSDLLTRILADAQQFAMGDQTKVAAQNRLHRKARVEVGTSTTADILTFTAVEGAGDDASTVANTFAQAFISQYVANQVAQYTGQVTALQTSIANLQATVQSRAGTPQALAAAEASINSLTQALQQLEAASQLVSKAAPSLINAATAPSTPSSPRPVTDAVLGFVVGLLLGVAVAFLRDHLDDKIDSVSDLEDHSGGKPVVGFIPMVESWRRDASQHVAMLENGSSPVAEAYRTLRTAVQFLGLDDSQRVIGITSSAANEGKSTVTANVAVSYASAGQRVIAVSFDFRRPRLHRFFGLDNTVGATSVLLGHVPLQEALQAIDGQPSLRVLSSGPIPPNPAEILSADRVRLLMTALADNADVVIIDCPPVLPVTDTLLISRLCDSIYVIAVASSTTKNELGRTFDLLGQVNAPVRGTIVNKVSLGQMEGSGYGYGGYYDYSSENDVKSRSVLSWRRPKGDDDRSDVEGTLSANDVTYGPVSVGVAGDEVQPNGR